MGSFGFRYKGLLSYSRAGWRTCNIMCLSEAGGGARWQVLEQMDKELSKGNERAALSLVKDLQGKPGGLRCFGTARQVLNSVLLLFLHLFLIF